MFHLKCNKEIELFEPLRHLVFFNEHDSFLIRKPSLLTKYLKILTLANT